MKDLMEKYAQQRAERVEAVLKKACEICEVPEEEVQQRVTSFKRHWFNSEIERYLIDGISVFEVTDTLVGVILMTEFKFFDQRLKKIKVI